MLVTVCLLQLRSSTDIASCDEVDDIRNQRQPIEVTDEDKKY